MTGECGAGEMLPRGRYISETTAGNGNGFGEIGVINDKEGLTMPAKWLSEAEAKDYLRGAFYGRLATCADGQPYITPVNFAFADPKIYIHCHVVGRKLDNITANPRVCFEVSEPKKLVRDDLPCNYGTRFTSVLAFGPARIIDEPEAKLQALNLIIDKYAAGHPHRPISAADTGTIKIIEITVEQISGKINVDPA